MVKNDAAYLAAKGVGIGQVYKVAVGNPGSKTKEFKNDITFSNDTIGLAVNNNYVYAAQKTARLYEMSLAGAVGPATGVLVIFVDDPDAMYWLQTFSAFTSAVNVSASGNYVFVARSTGAVGIIEANNGSDARTLNAGLAILPNHVPSKVCAYMAANGDILVFVLSNYNWQGVKYLLSYRLD